MAKTRKVILMLELSSRWSRGLLEGISEYSHIYAPFHSYRLSQDYWEPWHRRKKNELTLFKNWGVEGIITREMDIIDDLLALNVPIIGFDHETIPDNIPYITENYSKTGQMAAEHFLDRGFKNFAYCGYSDMKWSIMRGKSFCERVHKAGYEVLVYEKPMSIISRLWKNETTNMANWASSLPTPIGVMACSDGRSQHFIEACKMVNLHVPENVAVVGVDNDKVICNLSTPTLSSISFDTKWAGFEAARLLDKMMDNNDYSGHNIITQPTHIETRHSTDILAIDDKIVVQALRFIRTHSRERIQVDDVVKEVGCSRRSLEQRFKITLKRTVLAEIKRVYVDEIAKMLIKTNSSLKRIAMEIGYYDVSNFTRYFKQQTGMTPKQYRKRYGSY